MNPGVAAMASFEFLTSLNIAGCAQVSCKGLAPVLRTCSHLAALHVGGLRLMCETTTVYLDSEETDKLERIRAVLTARGEALAEEPSADGSADLAHNWELFDRRSLKHEQARVGTYLPLCLQDEASGRTFAVTKEHGGEAFSKDLPAPLSCPSLRTFSYREVRLILFLCGVARCRRWRWRWWWLLSKTNTCSPLAGTALTCAPPLRNPN